MNTEYTSKDYFTTHHPESFQLHQIEWLLFGHVNFGKRVSHEKENQSRLIKFGGLMSALAMFCQVKKKKLAVFENHELKPESDFHHVHFLIARHNLKNLSAVAICELLTQKATEFEFSKCDFSPFDASQDGVGYVTKRVYRTLPNGQRQEVPPEFYFSDALKKLIKEKDPK